MDDRCEGYETLVDILHSLQQELAKRTTYCVEVVRLVSFPALNIISSRVPPTRYMAYQFKDGFLRGTRMTASQFDRQGRIVWGVGDPDGPRYNIYDIDGFDYDRIIREALLWIDHGSKV